MLLLFFMFMWPRIVTNFFILKSIRCTNFQNFLDRHETMYLLGSSSAHHQEFIHCTLGPGWSCSRAVFKPVWHIPLPSAQWINSWWWAEELPETCTVSCWSKFWKLVHLVGFIIKKSYYCYFPELLLFVTTMITKLQHFTWLFVDIINTTTSQWTHSSNRHQWQKMYKYRHNAEK
jgi:hypothetical protein